MNDISSTVLVVDDEPMNLELIGVYLQDANVSYVGVESGDEAWALLQSRFGGRFDVASARHDLQGLESHMQESYKWVPRVPEAGNK